MGYGFLEAVYENAMMIELQKFDLCVSKQEAITVYYEDQVVSRFFADILVENKVILELKAVSKLILAHEAQLLNYLKVSKLEVGLLINFGTKPEFKRRVLSNTN